MGYHHDNESLKKQILDTYIYINILKYRLELIMINQLNHDITTVTNRILRDMNEGVLTIGNNGEIEFINEKAIKLLNLPPKEYVRTSFISLFIDNEKNDNFVELILNAVYEKEKSHSNIISFFGDTEKIMKITTSYLFNEDNQNKIGVVVVIEDITEIEKIRKSKNEAIMELTLLITGISVFMLVWQTLLVFGEPPKWIMARVMEIIAVGIFIYIKKKTSFTNADLGLTSSYKNIRKSILWGLGISIGIIGVMAFAKLCLCNIYPERFGITPFFQWHMTDDITQPTYFFVAPFQEFLSKSVMLGCLLRIFDQHNKQFPLIISSLLFSIFHVTYGLPMMIAVTIMNYFLGLCFIKQRNIWGCSIVHFTIGFFGTCFNFL